MDIADVQKAVEKIAETDAKLADELAKQKEGERNDRVTLI